MAAVRGLVSYGDSSSDEEGDAVGLVAKYANESPQAPGHVAKQLPAAEQGALEPEPAAPVQNLAYDVMPPVPVERGEQEESVTGDYPIGPPPPPADSDAEAAPSNDQDMYGPMPVPAGADDVMPYATVVQEDAEMSGAPDAHPLLDRLPAEIIAPEDPSSQLFARLSQYVELSRSGHDFTSVLRRRAEWGNPSLLTTIIDELDIDQYGACMARAELLLCSGLCNGLHSDCRHIFPTITVRARSLSSIRLL
jgi:hypothetical protein